MIWRRITIPIVLVTTLLSGNAIKGNEPSVIFPIDQTSFTAIDGPPILEPNIENRRVRPFIEQVAPVPKVEVKSTPKPKKVVKVTGHSTSGVASWYCKTGTSICTRGHPGGMYAAIRRDLLYLRGKTVKVSFGGKSIYVTLIDCNCGANANLIDLYSDAFRKLAPLGSGRIKVTVSW